MSREYIPKAARPIETAPIPVMYGIGVPDGSSGYGMTDGPFEKEEDALEIIGREGSFLLALDGVSQKVLWAWKEDRWVSED